MKVESEATKDRMALLNNAIVPILESSEATPTEAIVALRLLANRLEKAFELSCMGNPVSGIAKKVKDGS